VKCPECGFDYDALASAEVPGELLRLTEEGAGLLEGNELTRRPSPDVWSALEYACHVRDLILVQRDRLVIAVAEDKPGFAPMYRDVRPDLTGYDEEDPALVATSLRMAAALFAQLFERLTLEQLSRKCLYNFPEPTEKDIAWVGVHTVHEAVHHTGDMRSVLESVNGQ
jgi:DNA segregation ATPase FtsK/SpoIIIE, S-DNA-T family